LTTKIKIKFTPNYYIDALRYAKLGDLEYLIKLLNDHGGSFSINQWCDIACDAAGNNLETLERVLAKKADIDFNANQWRDIVQSCVDNLQKHHFNKNIDYKNAASLLRIVKDHINNDPQIDESTPAQTVQIKISPSLYDTIKSVAKLREVNKAFSKLVIDDNQITDDQQLTVPGDNDGEEITIPKEIVENIIGHTMLANSGRTRS
jgi:hypothetical protein